MIGQLCGPATFLRLRCASITSFKRPKLTELSLCARDCKLVVTTSARSPRQCDAPSDKVSDHSTDRAYPRHFALRVSIALSENWLRCSDGPSQRAPIRVFTEEKRLKRKKDFKVRLIPGRSQGEGLKPSLPIPQPGVSDNFSRRWSGAADGQPVRRMGVCEASADRPR